MAGFADQYLTNGATLITEHQLGIRLIENAYAVTEWRRVSTRLPTQNSLGLGIEYLIKW